MQLVATQNMINVGLSEMAVSKDTTDVLTILGLGSCIALCAYDPVCRVGALAHMVLPRSRPDSDSSRGKYIDTGVPWLLQKMSKLGVDKSNLIIKITGGARMLNIPGNNSFLDIGQKNIVQIKETLAKEGLKICAEELGGGLGRSVRFYVESGRIQVKAVNGKIIDL
jgi:chemotaxis protein CheD